MSKLAPQRKRAKRVAKKIERRFGLAHYDRDAIAIRKLAIAMDPLVPTITDDTLSRMWRECFLPLMTIKKVNDDDE